MKKVIYYQIIKVKQRSFENILLTEKPASQEEDNDVEEEIN